MLNTFGSSISRSAAWASSGRKGAAHCGGGASPKAPVRARHAAPCSSGGGGRRLAALPWRTAAAPAAARVRASAVGSNGSSGTDSDADDDLAGDADDFYAILGVSPRATSAEIKAAYRALMKDVHPDLSGDEDSAEFAVLLNEVYSTLVDPDKRAAYDAVAGFDLDSLNPFLDASLPADSVFVDELTCIGCRNCCNVAPASFAIEDEWGRARVMVQGADTEDKLQEAIDTCPVSCIHWVTSPQLSLLEAAMERMERTAVWILMGGGGNGARDVFAEASLAWERRRAAARARMEAERNARAREGWAWAAGGRGFGFGGGGSTGGSASAGFYEQARRAAAAAANGGGNGSAGASSDGEDAAGSGSGSESSYDGSSGSSASGAGRERARVAALAARAARAARQYREWQAVAAAARRAQRGMLLTTASSASVSSADGSVDLSG